MGGGTGAGRGTGIAVGAIPAGARVAVGAIEAGRMTPELKESEVDLRAAGIAARDAVAPGKEESATDVIGVAKYLASTLGDGGRGATSTGNCFFSVTDSVGPPPPCSGSQSKGSHQLSKRDWVIAAEEEDVCRYVWWQIEPRLFPRFLSEVVDRISSELPEDVLSKVVDSFLSLVVSDFGALVASNERSVLSLVSHPEEQ